MLWFKHNSQLSQKSDAGRVLAELKVEGYGRFMLLLEVLTVNASNLESMKSAMTVQQWAQILHLKQKKVETFLEHLENISIIKVEHFDNLIEVEICNPSEYFSNRAVSSKDRGPSGSPKREEKRKYNELSLKNDEKNMAQLKKDNPHLRLATEAAVSAYNKFESNEPSNEKK